MSKKDLEKQLKDIWQTHTEGQFVSAVVSIIENATSDAYKKGYSDAAIKKITDFTFTAEPPKRSNRK